MGNTKNTWFKHFNDASSGNSLKLLWAEKDYETIAFWWRLLELVSAWESDSERGSVVLSYQLFKRELGWNLQRTSRVLLKIAQSFKVQIEPITDGKTFKLSVPNFSKYQETRGGKKGSKNEQKPDRYKSIDIRDKKKEIIMPNKCAENDALFDENFSARWKELTDVLDKALLPIHLQKLGFIKNPILKHFSSSKDLKDFLNPHIANYQAAAKTELSADQISASIYKKLKDSVTEWEHLEASQVSA